MQTHPKLQCRNRSEVDAQNNGNTLLVKCSVQVDITMTSKSCEVMIWGVDIHSNYNFIVAWTTTPN